MKEAIGFTAVTVVLFVSGMFAVLASTLPGKVDANSTQTVMLPEMKLTSAE